MGAGADLKLTDLLGGGRGVHGRILTTVSGSLPMDWTTEFRIPAGGPGPSTFVHLFCSICGVSGPRLPSVLGLPWRAILWAFESLESHAEPLWAGASAMWRNIHAPEVLEISGLHLQRTRTEEINWTWHTENPSWNFQRKTRKYFYPL